MRWYKVVLAAMSLISNAVADSWHTERCYCANFQEVGFVLSFEWQSDRYNRTYSWYVQNNADRPAYDLGNRPVGQRCENGKCVNIPDLLEGYPLLNPITSRPLCNTFDDRRVCSSSSPLTKEFIAAAPDYQHEFDPKAMRYNTLMSCHDTCTKKWYTANGGAYDICSYTDKKTGALVPAGMKLDRDGKLKERAQWGSWYNCKTEDAPYFSSPTKRFTTVGGTRLEQATPVRFVA